MRVNSNLCFTPSYRILGFVFVLHSIATSELRLHHRNAFSFRLFCETFSILFQTTFMPATISANRVQILSSSAGEKEIEFEPEDYQPRSSVKVQLSGRKLLVGGDSRNVSSKGAKKIYKQGEKMGSNFKRLFGEKDEITVQGEASDYEEEIYNYRNYGFCFKSSPTKVLSVVKGYLAIWGAEGIAFQSANGKSKESKKRLTKKPDLVSSGDGKNAQDGSKREDMENSFFLGMNFLKAKWTMMPTETKKETQEKIEEIACQ
ncbi:LOW QUALITY PROTEIN: hypothetical protein HID58_061419 [Brassica napus]|uniref:Uncharacterized protein n=1 Tax=Brassica napus TaxID=3708 RepID=A0ABQ7ZZB5_BRANA|nr:LOW QUALITY PROTEIN: hypothetical protein HID58_061419 [Brassica napus]